MFILSCSAALAFGLFPFAAGQSVASGDRGKMETAPRPGLECLQVTLLIRQMVLDRYDSTGTGILSEQDKARLVEDVPYRIQHYSSLYNVRYSNTIYKEAPNCDMSACLIT